MALTAPSLVVGRTEPAMAKGSDATDGAEEPVRFDYRAAAGCLDEASFVASVRARTTRARLAHEGERARTFRVRLEATTPASGSVTVIDGTRAEGTRTVGANTCADAADALSLIVALAIDPRAMTTPMASASPSSATTAAVASSSEPPPLAPPTPAPPAPVPSSRPYEPEKARETTATEARPSPLERHFFGGVDLAAATGVAPTTLVGGAPYVAWRHTGASPVGLSVRAAFLRIGSGDIHPPGGTGTADLTWTTGRVDGCGLLRPDRALRFGGCGRVEAGVLSGSGHAIAGATAGSSLWIAGGALARIEWTILGALLLDVEAGPTARVNAERVYFLPSTTVYQVPFVGFDAEGGLGVHFL
jgi:hypothetical protein